MNGGTPSRDEVQAALERVLSSPGFASAGRLPAFLRHLVTLELNGEADRLKESLLGIELFERGPDFDPRTDPVVRVEARRLRQRLADHYRGPGADDPICISVPKGGYIPVFEAVAAGAEAPAARRHLPRNFWPWAIVALLVAASAAGIALWVRRPPPLPLTIAVLPFEVVPAAPDQDYFADGLTEEILDRLAALPSLRVVARGLTAPYKGTSPDPRAVAETVKATHLLEGSVRRDKDRLRVAARLIDGRDGHALWSHTYERRFDAVFALQDEIAQSIANALNLRTGGTPQPLPRRYTRNLDAYTAYLQGRYQANLYSGEGMRRAIDYLDRALELQPDYAPAHALLAQVYAMLIYYNDLPGSVSPSVARTHAERAIALDPSLPEAHASLGFVVAFFEWNWSEAEKSMKKAIELDPSSAVAHALYAVAVLGPQMRPEALDEFRTALSLDPTSSFANFAYAFGLLATGDADQAILQYQRTLELKNIHPDMYWDYGMALGYAKRYAEARKAFVACLRMNNDPNPTKLVGLMAYFSGDVATARATAPLLDDAIEHGGEDRMDGARFYAMLGETGRALDLLEAAVKARETQVIWAKADPRLASLRGLPRYQAILEALGLK